VIRGRIGGCELGADFTFFAIIAMFAALDTTGFALLSLAACLIHEAGHLAVMLAKGHKPPSVILRGGGIKISADAARADSFAVLIAGSAANIAVFAALYIILPQPYTNIYPIMFAAMNLVIGLFNLLPLGCLDGKRLLALILPSRVVRAVEIMAFAAVIAVLAASFTRGGANFTLAAAMIYVISVDFFERLWYNERKGVRR
jgi:Zn-dependent protease